MKTTAIDYILRAIETAADARNYPIEEIADYCAVCQILTNFDHDGTLPTPEQKMFIAETLETMCKCFGIDYGALLHRAICVAIAAEENT